MRTPSLRRRVTRSGVVVFAGLLLAFDIFLYLTLRDGLEATLDEVLGARVELTQEIAAVVGPDELVAQLTTAGVPVVVTLAGGEVLEAEPALPRFDSGPPGPLEYVLHPRVSATVALDDGATVEVFATRAGVDRTLQHVLTLLAIGTVLAVIAAVLLFRRSAAVAMAPLEQVVDKAGRTAAGHPGERLEPDDPDSELGRVAVAYDHMLDTLEAAVEQAHAAEERTRRFLDDAAHQLRTPIAAVRASVESLLRTTSPEERDLLMANVVRETGRTSRVLNDLLALAHLDAGTAPRRRPTDLVTTCRDEIERAASLAPRLSFDLEVVSESQPPLMLEERQIRDAVGNLLDNARRHARARVDVRIQTDADTIEIRVHDDGDGIPDDLRDEIFERFVSIGAQGGTGLGLPIARSIARRHGGELDYEGGAFVLRLPIVSEVPPADQPG